MIEASTVVEEETSKVGSVYDHLGVRQLLGLKEVCPVLKVC